jgi:hypothetical protein
MELKKFEKDVTLELKKIKYGEYYAIWGMTISNKFNVKVFDQMRRNGWRLISINWGDAVFENGKYKRNG